MSNAMRNNNKTFRTELKDKIAKFNNGESQSTLLLGKKMFKAILDWPTKYQFFAKSEEKKNNLFDRKKRFQKNPKFVISFINKQ